MTDPSPAHRRPTRRERREQALADALRGLLQDLVSDGEAASPPDGPPLELTLRLAWQPGQGGVVRFDPPLGDQVEDQIREQALLWAPFVEGAVFDFHAGTSTGPSCRPPSPRHVFAGYDAGGTARWEILPMMRAGEPSVAEVRKGRELRDAQAPTREDWILHGQAAVGFFPVPKAFARLAGDEVLALTVQIVETHGPRAAFRLRTNVLAGGLLPQEVQDLLQEPAFHDCREALHALSDELSLVESVAAEARARQDTRAFREAMGRLPACLDQFRERLLRSPESQSGFDAADWRQVRESSQVYFDTRRDSWVVLGEGSRAHVLGRQGEPITTFDASPAMVRDRVASGRWRPATGEEREALRRFAPTAL